MTVRNVLVAALGIAWASWGTLACSSDSPTEAPAPDASAEAGPRSDGGATDSGGAVDSGGGGGTCQLSHAGCTAGSMTDVGDTDTTVKFGTNGNTYEPKCLRIKVGHTVTFEGNFGGHHFLPAACNAPGTPPENIIPVTKSGTNATAKFTKPGIYAYYCDFHGDPAGSATLMDGLVEVVP